MVARTRGGVKAYGEFGGDLPHVVEFDQEVALPESAVVLPSVTSRKPISSCIRTTPQIASCWMRVSSARAISALSAARRAATSASGRIRLPTCSARNGGLVGASMDHAPRRARFNGDGSGVQGLQRLHEAANKTCRRD